jgi:hypothetical protein
LGDTGSEFAGLVTLIIFFCGIVGVIGFKIIDRIEARRAASGKSETLPSAKKDHQAGAGTTETTKPLTGKAGRRALVILGLLLVGLVIVTLPVILLHDTPPVYQLGQAGNAGSWKLVVKSYQQPGQFLKLTPDQKVESSPVVSPSTSPTTPTRSSLNAGNEVTGSGLNNGGSESNSLGSNPAQTLPKARGTWLVVELELENTGNSTLSANSFDFEAIDSRGNLYQVDNSAVIKAFLATQAEKSVIEGTAKPFTQLGEAVDPGKAVQLEMVFDIDPVASGIELIFKQGSNPHFKVTPGQPR